MSETYQEARENVVRIAVIVSPILWISFWTVVNRIRKAHRKRKKMKEAKESESRC